MKSIVLFYQQFRKYISNLDHRLKNLKINRVLNKKNNEYNSKKYDTKVLKQIKEQELIKAVEADQRRRYEILQYH
jgi:hypothetical protein